LKEVRREWSLEKETDKMSKKEKKKVLFVGVIILTILVCTFLFSTVFLSALNPGGPSNVVSVSNKTKGTTSAAFFNLSGGYIAALNLTANIQDVRWKAFVGWVNGKFTLSDSGGSTIYDWTLSVTTGRVYATRVASAISWASMQCANRTTSLNAENLAMFHNSSSDNITKTFQYGTHNAFWVAGIPISANSCPTLKTYINNVSQGTSFQEMALYDSTNIIYATLLENRIVGYDGQAYDFQMLVPENGSQGFTGATPYYLYVELD
jgi:hypothetical protein